MRDYVIINGVNSLTINGLAISKLPPISKPLMRNIKEEIDGRDGDIITELGYSAYDKEMEIGLYGNFDINEVISFFNGEGTITFSNEDDKHYYFKILEQIDYEKLLKFKTATITFHCQPFKYPNNETIIEADSVTVEGTGSIISLSNTTLHESMKMDLLGDTFQDGTPSPSSPITVETVTGVQNIKLNGKNIFKVHEGNTVSSVNVQFTRNSDGTITLNGTSNGVGYVEILYAFQNGTAQQTTPTILLDSSSPYKLSFLNLSGTTTSTDTRFVYQYNSTGDQATIYPNNSQTISNSNGLYRAYFRIPSGATFNNYTVGIQLETGSQATSFEEYKESIYEINLGTTEICKIGTYQDFIRKGTGKNLLDFETKNIGAGISMSIGSTGTLNSSSTGICTWIEMKNGESYTFSGDLSNLNSNVVRCLVTNDEVQIGTTCLRVDNFSASNYTYTNSNNYKYLVLVFTGTTTVGSNWQLENSNIQTLYEPFGFNGKWYLYKTIGKYVADNDLTGNGQSETRIDLLTPVLDIQASLSATNLGQMSMTNVLTTSPTGTINQGLSGTTNVSKIRVQLSKEYANNNTEANSFLKNKNFTIYYVSNNPTATEITNEALLTQLNALSNATGYEGTTNISSSGYLPTILNVSAIAIPTTTITNIGNIYAKPLLTIRGSGDISIYLNGIQLLQIALGDREEITIDISKMEAYDEETKVLLNRLVIGDYSNFLINSGNNELIITGDVSNFSMSGYTRWL